jgi:hypothetical protein
VCCESTITTAPSIAVQIDPRPDRRSKREITWAATSCLGSSAQRLHLRLRLIQIEAHVLLAIHRPGGGEVLVRRLVFQRLRRIERRVNERPTERGITVRRTLRTVASWSMSRSSRGFWPSRRVGPVSFSATGHERPRLSREHAGAVSSPPRSMYGHTMAADLLVCSHSASRAARLRRSVARSTRRQARSWSCGWASCWT